MTLVVGGAGYIGSHMLQLLRREGEEHLVFDNLESGHEAALQGSRLFKGDLRNPGDLTKCFAENLGIDLVMHFAAYISVGESVREPDKYIANNVGGSQNLLQAMRESGVERLVFSSTAAIFGNPEYVPIDEAHPKAPLNPYGESKLKVEKLLEGTGSADTPVGAASQAPLIAVSPQVSGSSHPAPTGVSALPVIDTASNLKSVCLRYFNAAGADPSGEIGEDHDPEEHLIPVAILSALGKRPPMQIFGTDYDTPDGTCVRDYVHILDLAEAHLLAVKHLRSGGESRQYNLGNGNGFSVKKVLDTVEKVIARPVPRTEGPRRPGDAAILIASSERIRQDWGWLPQYPELESIVEHAWNWHSKHPSGFND